MSTDIDFSLLASGKLQSNLSNLIKMFSLHPEWQFKIGFNSITRNVYKFGVLPFEGAVVGEWLETDMTAARVWVFEEYSIQPTITDTMDAIKFVAQRRVFNPVSAYLNSLEWDKIPRIDTFHTNYLGCVDRRVYRTFIRSFFLSAAARGSRPGEKVDTTLILIGKQGCKKSSVVKALFTEEYFTDAPLRMPSKDAFMLIRGKWVVELAEFDKYTSAEVASMKSWLTQVRDESRDPYARATTTVQRSCVFVGTTNVEKVLMDMTGNRRFMTIRTGDAIDVTGVEQDRDQLWAEAKAALDNGESWVFDEDDPDVQAELAGAAVIDPWEDLIIDWLEETNVDEFHASSLYPLLGVTAKQVNKREAARLDSILVKHGYVKALNGILIAKVRRMGYTRCMAKLT